MQALGPLLQDLAALRGAWDQAQAQRREAGERLAALEAQTAAKQSQAELLQLQLRSLQEALEAERRQSARLAEAEAALKKTRSAFAEERELKKRRGRIIGELCEQVAVLEAAQRESNDLLAEKEARLQAFRSSTSWRITAPCGG